jgi:hypothetical protein
MVAVFRSRLARLSLYLSCKAMGKSLSQAMLVRLPIASDRIAISCQSWARTQTALTIFTNEILSVFSSYRRMLCDILLIRAQKSSFVASHKVRSADCVVVN